MENKMLDKIKKLVNKQNSASELGNIAEAETFAQKVQELLAKYNLDMADIKTDEELADEIGLENTFKVMYPTIGGQSAYDVLRVIARFNFCRAFIQGNRSNNIGVLAGTKENIEVVRYINDIVSKIFIEESKRHYKNYVRNEDYLMDGKIKPVGYDTFARTFIRGAAIGLSEKLEAEQEKFKSQNSKSTDLVVTNKLILNNFLQKHGNIKKSASGRVSDDGGAYGKGKKVGRTVEVNKGLGSKESKPITRKQLS